MWYNKNMEKFVVIDGNSLINRAFYGLPALKSLNGKPCGATFGFCNMLLNIIINEKPKYIACVFDAGKHTFRNNLYENYKANRDKMPEDLFSQLEDLKQLLKYMGIKVIEIPEIEADDIIGSISRKYDAEFILISGDKDLFQLINNNTTVWHTKRGVTDVVKLDEQALKKEYNLKPYQVIEIKSIMGDSSDNIPGVAGIGKVGAMKLIEQYDNLDNIYAHINEIKGSTKDKLLKNKDMAYLSHQLATIKLDVELEIPQAEFEYSLPLNKACYDMMQELGFKSLISRKELFSENIKTEQQASDKSEIIAEKIEIDNQTQFNEMLTVLQSSFAVLFDDFALYLAKDNKEYVIYITSEIFGKNIEKIRELFAGEIQKICFDTKLLMHKLNAYNIDINNYFDVSMSIYIANELDAEIKLEDAIKLNNISTNSNCLCLFKLKEIYINKLINSMQLKLYSQIELPLVKVLFDMEITGLKVDENQIRSLSKTYHEELDCIRKKIYNIAGCEFNVNSPKQLQDILFNKLKIEYNGKAGTSVEVLNAIQNKHEIVPLILRYRKISKLLTTYLDGMLDYIENDGKIHTTFMQRTTATGRLSSREPNLQNLPIRDSEGKLLRKMFSSSFENGSMISADYNQIELRLMANFSKDQDMIADYKNGKDFHTATASKIFNVPIVEVTSQMRRVAKSVNFGIIYGISAYGLSQNIECSPKEAGQFIDKYFEVYPKVKQYGENLIVQAREKGYAETIMGRIRHLPDINSKNHVIRSFAERVSKNMPLQGSASDIIKIAMINVFNRIKNEKLKSKLVLQIHDELIIDCYPNESKKIRQILKDEMENVVDLEVPLIVDISEGKTLYDAK